MRFFVFSFSQEKQYSGIGKIESISSYLDTPQYCILWLNNLAPIHYSPFRHLLVEDWYKPFVEFAVHLHKILSIRHKVPKQNNHHRL